MAEHHTCLPRPQHVTVINAIRAQRHRRHERHELALRVRRPPPGRRDPRLIDQRLDPKPPSEHHRQRHPGVGDHPLVIEQDSCGVRQMMVTSWCRPAVALHDSFLPAQEVS